MKHTILAPALATALLALMAAPLSAADKETRQMMADIRMLQEQSQELQNHLGALTEALKALNGRIDQQTEASRKLFADQKITIDAVSGDLRIVRERMDDNSVRLGSLAQEVDALRQTVMQINLAPAPQATETSAEPGAAPSAGAAPVASPMRSPSIGGGLSPSAAYQQAMADYWIGQYDLAVVGLEAYIREFPRSEQADDAQVNIGNAYFQQGKYDKALEAYDLAIRTYPKSDSMAQAQTRKGVSLAQLRRPEEARGVLEAVIKTYPDSTEATIAKQALDKLPAPPAPAPATRRP